MCDSNNFHEEDNLKNHFPWHTADEIRRRTQGLAGSKRKEYLYSPATNEKQKENNMEYCFK